MAMEQALKDAFIQFSRNEKWGTCVDCPRDTNGHAYPEFCSFTSRQDHLLTIDELVRIAKIHL